MCQMRIVKETSGIENLLFEDVTHLKVIGENKLAITSLFGGTVEIKGKIQSIDFTAGKLLIDQS